MKPCVIKDYLLNENGVLIADFCAVDGMAIRGTLYLHKSCHKTTWVSPAADTENLEDGDHPYKM